MDYKELNVILNGDTAKNFIRKHVPENEQLYNFENRPEGACRTFLQKYFEEKKRANFAPFVEWQKFKNWELSVLNIQKEIADYYEGTGDLLSDITAISSTECTLEIPKLAMSIEEIDEAIVYAILTSQNADKRNLLTLKEKMIKEVI